MDGSDVVPDGDFIGSAYILGPPISSGAMGRVFRGTHRADGAPVAIKILREELARDPGVVSRFVQERQLLTSLSHPNLLRVHDMVVEGDRLAIIMDYFSGGTLRDRLTTAHTLAPADAAILVAQVLDAVATAHAANVVHRDLKPENILLANDGSARVADFGIARLTDGASLTRASGYIGSAEYMAPECANGEPASPPADIYAVGCLLYELLVGVTPFVGGPPPVVLLRQVRNAPMRPVGVPGSLWDVLRRMLAKEPDSRPSGVDGAAELRSIAATLVGLRALPSLSDPAFGSAATMLPRQRALLTGGTPALHSGGHHSSGSSLTTLPSRSRAELPMAPAPPPPTTRPFWRQPVAGVAAVVLVLATTIAVVAWPSAGQAANPPVVVFTPQTFPSGLTVNRTWKIHDSKQRELDGELRLVNSGKAVLAVTFDEVLPRSVATSPNQVSWRPGPAEVIRPDLIVRYRAPALAPGSLINVSYSVGLPKEGNEEAQLRRLADDQRAAESAYQAQAAPEDRPARLRQLSVEPASLDLVTGASLRVTLSGELDSGQPAPDAALADTSWTSSAAEVAGVSGEPGGGTVHALRTGVTTLTATIGSIHGATEVRVSAGASAELRQAGIAGPQPKDPGRAIDPGKSISDSPTSTPTNVGVSPIPINPVPKPPDPSPSPTPPAIEPLVLAPVRLPDAIDGLAYQHKLTVSGGQPPYQWSATDLPGGLSVNGNGVTGRPLVDVIGTIGVGGTIRVSDAKGQTASQHFTLNITRITDDLNRDGVANCTDLSILKGNMSAHGVGYDGGDMNRDGTVDIFDLSYFLSHWPAGGPTCS